MFWLIGIIVFFVLAALFVAGVVGALIALASLAIDFIKAFKRGDGHR